MPAFGRDGILNPTQISQVADYVRSLSGLGVEQDADLAAGKQIFADNCAACHGDDGKGNREFGAPNLTDAIWLYGSDKDDHRHDHHQRPQRRRCRTGARASTRRPSRRWRSTSTPSAAA